MDHFSDFHDRYPAPLAEWAEMTGWPRFTEIQRLAIASMPIDPKVRLPDHILEAETSSGKTEAAFLPLFARHCLADSEQRGFVIVYVSPLVALINDTQTRLAGLGAAAGLPVYCWHRESESDKEKARKAKSCILLTTPESIEGFLVRAEKKPSELSALAAAQAIVIDELHAYFDTARGRHLQSLLHRIDERAGSPIPRIGLSATLGSIDREARETLRPKAKVPATVCRSTGAEARPITVAVKVFVDDPDNGAGDSARQLMPDRIAKELLSDLGSASRALVFANSRAVVETTYERLSELVGSDGPFTVARHHRSVPKKERLQNERDMRAEPGKDGAPERMVTICTNTLELGIDIGKVERVIQIDPTYTVSALRQRVGRSGRRKEMVSDGIIYVMENALADTTHPLERLRLRTVQAAATAQLSLEAAFEVPNLADLQLSPLYHQVTSLLWQHERRTTDELHSSLVLAGPWEQNGPLGDRAFFKRFLETMEEARKPHIASVEPDLWQMADDQKLSGHTYAMFSSPAEYAVMHGATVIGRLPVGIGYRIGETFVLNRGRWRVTSVNEARHTITVARAASAGAPRFGGPGQTPSGLVTDRIRKILQGLSIGDLTVDGVVQQVVEEGRDAYREHRLDETRFARWGRDTLLFPWVGSKLTETLVLILRREGLRAHASSFAITVEDIAPDAIQSALKAVNVEKIDLEELSREARRLQQERFDYQLIPYHLRLGYSRRALTLDGLAGLVRDVSQDKP